MDHADCIMRHLVDRGTVDPEDNLRHSGKIAWRALALLQEELEREEGAPLARAAKVEEPARVGPDLAAWVRAVIPAPKESSLDIARRQYGFPGEVPCTTEGCVL